MQALPLFVRASEGRVLMPHVPALVSETGPSESHSILTLTECRQTGSPVHWPIQNQSCHIMSLRSWRSSWCWRSRAPIRTNSCCVCWPGSGVCNCSSEWASVKMMFKLSPRPQWCRSLLLQDRNRLYKNEANGKPGGASVFADCELEASCHGGAPIMPFALISLKILQKPLLLSDPCLTDGLSPLLLCSGYI